MHGKVFDLRLPIGYLFAVLGGILTIKGIADSGESYAQSLGINLNLIWGLAMMLFGLACLLLAVRHRRAMNRYGGSGDCSRSPGPSGRGMNGHSQQHKA